MARDWKSQRSACQAGALAKTGSQQFFTSAGVGGNVGSFEQSGNNSNSARAGGNDFREIVILDSADAKDRQGQIEMHPVNIFQSNRFVIGLGWRGKDWTEANVIGPFALRCNGLLEAMS